MSDVSAPDSSRSVTRSSVSCWRWPRVRCERVLATALVEGDDLVGLDRVDDLGHHAGTRNHGRADGAADHQHVAEQDLVAGFGRQLFDAQHVTGFNPVLLAARLEDCEHSRLLSLPRPVAPLRVFSGSSPAGGQRTLEGVVFKQISRPRGRSQGYGEFVRPSQLLPAQSEGARARAAPPDHASARSASLQPFLLGLGQRLLAIGHRGRSLGELRRRGREQVGIGQEFTKLGDFRLQPRDDAGQRVQPMAFGECQAGRGRSPGCPSTFAAGAARAGPAAVSAGASSPRCAR